MAIAFGAAGTRFIQSTAGTSWSVAYPTVAADDLLILHVSTNGGAVTLPSGWTEVYREISITNPKGLVAIKVADGTESGTLAVTTSSTTGNAIMFSYTGVDPTTPQDAAATSVSNATAGFTTVLPAITTVTADTMLVYANGGNSSTTTMSSTTGTERVDHGALGGTGTKAGALYDEVVTATGSTGTRTIDLNASRANWGAMLALRPASAAGNTHTEDITTFENASDGIWAPTVAGSGTTAVQTSDKHDGLYGASANVPADTGDRAGFTTTFTGAQQATIAGWWKVTTEGASSSSNVPFARLFSGSQRLADVYRQNQQAGANLWLRVVKAIGGSNYYFIPTGYTLPLNTWVYISFTWGLDGNPYLWIDGTQYLGPADAPADWFAASSIDTAYLGTQEVGNQGAWSMDTVTLSTNTIEQATLLPLAIEGSFTGSGTLTSTQTPAASTNGTLSSTGTLSPAVTVAFSSAVGLSGSGTLSLSGITPGASPAVDLSGDGLLDPVQDSMAVSASGTLSSTGTLGKTVVANFTASMSQTSTGTLGVAVTGMSAAAAPAFSGSGTLSSTRTPAVSASGTLSGSGTLSTTQSIDIPVTANFSSEGTLTAASSNSFMRDATLSGSGTLSQTNTPALPASAALSSTGTLSVGVVVNRSVSASLSGSGALSSTLTSVGVKKTVPFTGSGTLSATSIVNRTSTAPLSGSGTLSTVASPHIDYVFVGSSSGSLSTVESPAIAVTAQFSGVGTLVAETGDLFDYDITAYLADKRWSSDLGSKRWKGSL
jgi:hypothetical protein